MKREKALFILAVLVMMIPNLGFTSMIEKIAYAAIGIILILIAYGIHFDKKRKIAKEKMIVAEPVREPAAQFEHQAKPRRTYIRREKPTPAPIIQEESIDDVIVEAPKPKTPDSYGFTYVKRETKNERTS